MITQFYRFVVCRLVIISFLFSSAALAQNKVVVIPLVQEASLPPFAPVPSPNPPTSDYTYIFGSDTAIDKVTGLVWQREDDNVLRNWEAAWDYCINNSEGLPGWGWRLPSVAELVSIVHYGRHHAAINPFVFVGTNSSRYWSSPTYSNNSTRASYVSFSSGSVNRDEKSNSHYVRCVRQLRNRDNLFLNNSNGTVTDLSTGLTWQQFVEDDNVSWAEAVSYCQELELTGGGWRLPNIKELHSIMDDRVFGPAIDTEAFPGTGPTNNYWSATTHVQDSNSAWHVGLITGSIHASTKTVSNNRRVRCVR